MLVLAAAVAARSVALAGFGLDSLIEIVASAVGLFLNAALGWWWADPLSAFVIVYYGIREGRAALGEATSASA